jgi:uncharacterized protein with PIN domain
MAEKFVADAMLGKLAKWLRMMGYDTHYQPRYGPDRIRSLVSEGRVFLTRNTRWDRHFDRVVFILSDNVGEQLGQLRKEGFIEVNREMWFTRCTLCNQILCETPAEAARENVPDYVFLEHPSGIRFCPSCRRFFWPGSHKQRMITRLEAWGFQER